jgi:hypothetical protein
MCPKVGDESLEARESATWGEPDTSCETSEASPRVTRLDLTSPRPVIWLLRGKSQDHAMDH